MTDDELVDRIARQTLQLLGEAIRRELIPGRSSEATLRGIADRLRSLDDKPEADPEANGTEFLGEMLLTNSAGQFAAPLRECSRCGCLTVTPSRHLC